MIKNDPHRKYKNSQNVSKNEGSVHSVLQWTFESVVQPLRYLYREAFKQAARVLHMLEQNGLIEGG